MIPIGRGIKAISIILFVAIATSFCASKHFLVVSYQLPEEPEILREAPVALVFKDSREDPAIVTKSAKMALKDFSGNFTLIVAQENKNDRLVGAFGLHSMIKQIFKHRLENAGIQVAPGEESRETVVEIILKTFKLDLVERKWVIKSIYCRRDDHRKCGTIAGSRQQGCRIDCRRAGHRRGKPVEFERAF
jgi:hypothetical protein